MASGSIFTDKGILVTGGTGTIGSEIVHQLLPTHPRVIRIFSRDETKQAHLRETLPSEAPVRFLIGDVRDRERLECALESVDIVFHAAALKHVPACEYNPFEAVQTNVVGTQNLIQACRKTGVGRLVFISTDKAVNPINTMGATKLLAENLVRASQEWNPRMLLSTVRFGNVLGSRGSLIPMIMRQMGEGRRVQLTAREMTRFMITIEEAVQLVLAGARRSRGGDLFILKMPSLRIADLVQTFVEEYAAIRGWDPSHFDIEVVGVRPGEKLHEELLTEEECTRMEEIDGMYVVRPPSRVERRAQPLPASCRSDLCPQLDSREIVALLERSGILEGIRAAQMTPAIVQEPAL